MMKWVRPLVVMALTAAVVTGFLTDRISSETFAAFATGLIVYWFKSRDNNKEGKP